MEFSLKSIIDNALVTCKLYNCDVELVDGEYVDLGNGVVGRAQFNLTSEPIKISVATGVEGWELNFLHEYWHLMQYISDPFGVLSISDWTSFCIGYIQGEDHHEKEEIYDMAAVIKDTEIRAETYVYSQLILLGENDAAEAYFKKANANLAVFNYMLLNRELKNIGDPTQELLDCFEPKDGWIDPYQFPDQEVLDIIREI